jgi:hypothetical protein
MRDIGYVHRTPSTVVLPAAIPWKTNEKSLSYLLFGDGVFRYGVPRVNGFHQIAPVIEYAIGEECSLELTMQSEGKDAYLFLLIGSSAAPLTTSTLGLKVSPEGSQLIACTNDFKNIPLSETVQPKWEQHKEYKLKLQRRGNDLIGYVNGQIIGRVSLTDPEQIQYLKNSPRFKLYGWQGSLHTIRNAVLVDGQEN